MPTPTPAPPPTGTLTFLFSDIEGSTRMWQAAPDAMQAALARHDAILRRDIEARGGHVFKTAGDAFYAAFATPWLALEAALAAQQALRTEPWPPQAPIRVRIALHSGAAELRDGDYFGPPLNHVARLLSAGHGGQTLVSSVTCELCHDRLPAGAALKSLGEHGLKDLVRRQTIYQLAHPALPQAFPPLRTLLAPLDAGVPSIAVLPFVNMSRDEENEFFADGLSEELLNVLAKIKGLRVASRTSAWSFKGTRTDIPTIAQKLGVAHLLEGSVRKAGNRVRITAQLIEVATDSHLWSETYDRELTDIFAVQDDIAQSVVVELRRALLEAKTPAAPEDSIANEVAQAAQGRGSDAVAYQLYLEGRSRANRVTNDDNARAIELFGQAVALQPDFALAWAGLSRAHNQSVAARLCAAGGRLRAGARGGTARAGPGAGPRRRARRAGAGPRVGRPRLEGRRRDVPEGDRSGTRQRGGIAFRELARRGLRADRRSDRAGPTHRRAGPAGRQRSRAAGAPARGLRCATTRPKPNSRRPGSSIRPGLATTRPLAGSASIRVATPRRSRSSNRSRWTGNASPASRSRAPAWVRRRRRTPRCRTSSRTTRRSRRSRSPRSTRTADEKDAAFDWLERAYVQHDHGVSLLRSHTTFRGLHDDPRWQAYLAKIGIAD